MKSRLRAPHLYPPPVKRGEERRGVQYRIEIRNEAPRDRVSVRGLKDTVRKILKALGFKKAAISVLLVGDRKIRVLNRRWLGHDRPTDVIAFGHQEPGAKNQEPRKSLSRFPVPGSRFPFLGDLVISLDTTRRQAAQYGNSFSYELAFYLCHGILHLMGYDDKSVREAARMDRKQRQVLETIGIKEKGKRKKEKVLWPSKKPKP